mmetsp:Transcript_19694/g.61985  ORF Transcript_19694/g.61985 Transcript_19694/m.61985 type:complete len:243 (-) Transcript_19694:25-753(-)
MPLVTSIGDGAFEKCAALESIIFPKATDMPMCGFTRCSALCSVSIPDATSLGSWASAWCTSLGSAPEGSLDRRGHVLGFPMSALDLGSGNRGCLQKHLARVHCADIDRAPGHLQDPGRGLPRLLVFDDCLVFRSEDRPRQSLCQMLSSHFCSPSSRRDRLQGSFRRLPQLDRCLVRRHRPRSHLQPPTLELSLRLAPERVRPRRQRLPRMPKPPHSHRRPRVASRRARTNISASVRIIVEPS